MVKGDNLKVLNSDYMNKFHQKVKLIYLDPPYNTGRSFTHYEDKAGSNWSSFMQSRLESLKPFLSDDGWVVAQIDDRELFNLKSLMDKSFGSDNHINTICVKMSEACGPKMKHIETRFAKTKEYLLVYRSSNKSKLNPERVLKSGPKFYEYVAHYTRIVLNPDEDLENWNIVYIKDYMEELGLEITKESLHQFKLDNSERVIYRTTNKSIEKMNPGNGLHRVVMSNGTEYVAEDNKVLLFLDKYKEEYLCDIWLDMTASGLRKEGGVEFKNSKKPEKLMERMVKIFSNEGDLVLDPFAGSGTTGIASSRNNREWIMIEEGNHTESVIEKRIAKEGLDIQYEKIYDQDS